MSSKTRQISKKKLIHKCRCSSCDSSWKTGWRALRYDLRGQILPAATQYWLAFLFTRNGLVECPKKMFKIWENYQEGFILLCPHPHPQPHSCPHNPIHSYLLSTYPLSTRTPKRAVPILLECILVQGCIRLGCVPPACWPYPVAVSVSGRETLLRGVCHLRGCLPSQCNAGGQNE